jgi:hypothetical protein
LAISIFLLGLSPLLTATYLDSRGIYRVRIEIFNPANEQVHDAEITSSAGGELKKTDAGWEFTIPLEEKPANGEVIFRASLRHAFLEGNSTLKLAKDYFPHVDIQLATLPSVNVRGIVEGRIRPSAARSPSLGSFLRRNHYHWTYRQLLTFRPCRRRPANNSRGPEGRRDYPEDGFRRANS